MKRINELLKKNDIRALSYKKSGNVIVADTNIGKVVIKKNNYKDYIMGEVLGNEIKKDSKLSLDTDLNDEKVGIKVERV